METLHAMTTMMGSTEWQQIRQECFHLFIAAARIYSHLSCWAHAWCAGL